MFWGWFGNGVLKFFWEFYFRVENYEDGGGEIFRVLMFLCSWVGLVGGGFEEGEAGVRGVEWWFWKVGLR